MSWLFSQALAEEYSVGTSLDGEQFAQLNLMPTEHKFSHNGKTMEPSSHSRFGLTCKVLRAGPGEELLMSFLAAFPVRTLVQPDLERGLMGSEADSGKSLPGSLARYDHDSHTWRTAQCSLFGGLTEFLGPWPNSGSMRNGAIYQQPPLVPTITEKESGFLPTPSGCRSGKNHVAGRLDEWGGSSNIWRGTEIGKMHCPAFEEWVMGWPEQWTELTAFEMGKFQQWQQQHSLSFVNEQVGKEVA
jgi:hypothetical protein